MGPVTARRRLPAPTEDDEIRLLLRRRLDDALRGVPPDPHDRVQGRPLGCEVEDALEESPGVAMVEGPNGLHMCSSCVESGIKLLGR